MLHTSSVYLLCVECDHVVNHKRIVKTITTTTYSPPAPTCYLACNPQSNGDGNL